MQPLCSISLIINLLLLSGLIVLTIFGKEIIKYIVFKFVIAVRHEQKVSMFRASPVLHGPVVMLGDSITEGGNWSELFPEYPILNRGIGGDVSEGVLKRLDEVLAHRPSKIFLCIGTNDVARGVRQEAILKNIRAILETVQAQSPATKIYVQSVFPVGRKAITGHQNEKVIPLNAEIKKICLEKKITYIDLYPRFIDKTGYLDPAYSNDRLHLMGNGYLLWKHLIEPYIQE
jgi:lysophospholipase L1-like esterase